MKTKTKPTKDKILEAALHEFSAHGVAGARVDEIARAAGVNKAMIYYHFESKQALFNELFQAEMESLQQEIASVLKQHDTTSTEEMTLAVRQILAYAKSKRTLLKVLVYETARQESRLPHLFQLLDVTTAIGIKAAQKNGLKLPEEEEPVFHEFFSGLLPLIYYTLFRDDLKKHYGWKEKTLDDRFTAYWLRHHGGY
jgi:TetR/AcrR family transcriptional regulator